MVSREELKSLIDQVPDAALEMVHGMLRFHIEPRPTPPPDVERMQRRGQEYRTAVEERFRQTLKAGTITSSGGRVSGGGMTGGGISGVQEGLAFGHNSFRYWDGKTLVEQTLQSYDGQEIEIMNRFSFTEDGSEFSCIVELASGGRTLRREERFPRVRTHDSGTE